MTRITENSVARNLLLAVQQNRQMIDKYGNEVSSGLKVADPGDSTFSGTISQLGGTLERLEVLKRAVSNITGMLTFQDDVLSQANELLVRAKEIAAQGANETNSETERAALAEEVFQLRDEMVSLANSKYLGSYIFSGNATDTPAYSAAAYTEGGSAASKERYVYTTALGCDDTRSVEISDGLSLQVNTPGNLIFDNAIQALERLGRSLQGYATTPASGAPDGGGSAYSMPADFSVQTEDIRDAMELLDTARESDIEPQRVNLGGRLKRLETAKSLLEMNITSAKLVLSDLRDADIVDSATNLSMAQTALEASLTVTMQTLNMTILDYL